MQGNYHVPQEIPVYMFVALNEKIIHIKLVE